MRGLKGHRARSMPAAGRQCPAPTRTTLPAPGRRQKLPGCGALPAGRTAIGTIAQLILRVRHSTKWLAGEPDVARWQADFQRAAFSTCFLLAAFTGRHAPRASRNAPLAHISSAIPSSPAAARRRAAARDASGPQAMADIALPCSRTPRRRLRPAHCARCRKLSARQRLPACSHCVRQLMPHFRRSAHRAGPGRGRDGARGATGPAIGAARAHQPLIRSQEGSTPCSRTR